MAVDTVIRAIITAVDRFSGPVRGIVASARGPVAAFGALGPAVANASTQMRFLLGPLLAVGGALSAAGLGKATADFANYSGAVVDTAVKLALGTRELQEFRYAAAASNIENGTFEGGITKLNQALKDAALGTAPLAKETFRQFGISLYQADGRLRTANDVLPELIKNFERLRGPGERAAVATALLGQSGDDLLPFLTMGATEFARLRAEANAFGMVIGDQALADGKAFGDLIQRMGNVVRGLALGIGGSLVPVLSPFVEKFTDWVVVNRELIAQRIERTVAAFAEALGNVDWDAVFQTLANIGNAIVTLAEWLGPTGSLVAALGFAFAPLILAFGQLAWAVVGVGGAVLKFGLAAAGITPFIGAFFTALKVGFGIFEALKLAMMLNPFGALMTAIVAVIGLGVLLYKNWDDIVKFLGGAWDWMRQQLAALMTSVVGFAESLAKLLPDWLGGKGLKASIEERKVAIRDWANYGGREGADSVAEHDRRMGQARGSLLDAAPEQRVGGEVVVKLEGAPAGTTVESVQSSGGIDIGVDVGRQPFPMGA